MPVRVSRASSHPLAMLFAASKEIDPGLDVLNSELLSSDVPDLEPSADPNEVTLTRLISVELRAAFTHVTIAQLAYDMGQIERGDQACLRAQESCTAAHRSIASLTRRNLDTLNAQLEFLIPMLEACRQQRSEFHPALRQPSLS